MKAVRHIRTFLRQLFRRYERMKGDKVVLDGALRDGEVVENW